jgi:hypothetical protein
MSITYLNYVTLNIALKGLLGRPVLSSYRLRLVANLRLYGKQMTNPAQSHPADAISSIEPDIYVHGSE